MIAWALWPLIAMPDAAAAHVGFATERDVPATSVAGNPIGGSVLIEGTALECALARLHGEDESLGAFDPTLTALRASTALAIERDTSLLPGVSSSSNLFLVQTSLLELSLQTRLEGSAACVQALTRLVRALGPEGTSDERLPTEVHAGFVIAGLAVALELAGESLSVEVVSGGYETIGRLAQRLGAGSVREAWAQRTANRMAWNHSAVAFAALGIAGLALPDNPRSREWVQLASEWSLLFFEHGITAAGMTREGLTYCGFVFRNLFPFLAGARAIGAFDYLDPEQNPFLERLALIPTWYAGEIFPAGKWLQNVNDSYWDPNPALAGFLPTFSALDKTRVMAVWQQTVGEQGTRSYGADPSLRWSTVFESVLWGPVEGAQESRVPGDDFFYCDDVGYVRKWTPERDWGFSFNCGSFIGSIHDQSDNNSFTLFAEGLPVVLDAGAANRAEEGSPSSSYGHSAVLVDGRGQAPAGGGRGVSARLDPPRREPHRTIVMGDATASYSQYGYNPLLRARRLCVFAESPVPYLLVYDDIQKDESEHDYDLLLHTPTPVDSTVDSLHAQMSIALDERSTRFAITVLHPHVASIASEPFDSPGQPPFARHTLWRVSTSAVNPSFVVLLTAGRGASLQPLAKAEIDGDRVSVAMKFDGCPEQRLVLSDLWPRQSGGHGPTTRRCM